MYVNSSKCLKHKVKTMANQIYKHYSGSVPYEAPEWARSLRDIPTSRVQLGHLNTPIHKWKLAGLPSGIDLYIKRDDMTGSTLSGNKVRKLEFIFADALKRGCKHIMTCGGIQSNHCRATAVAATQLGLQSHLFLRVDIKGKEDVTLDGNMFLNRLCGANIYITPRKSPYETHLKPRMEKLAEHIKSKSGEDSCLIPVGGSNSIGMWGYLNAFEELVNQGVLDNFDDIVFTCGSGGTADGLALANYLTGSRVRLHAIAVCDNAEYFYGHINETLKVIGQGHLRAEDLVEIVEGYKGLGYGISTQEELDFIAHVAETTGIMVDPVYTGKGVKGMLDELQANPQRFQGNRILFIHTGGIFGMYDGTLHQTLQQSPGANQLNIWSSIDSPPF